MEEKIQRIQAWLKDGSINLFGLPMSGKDTVGLKLSELLGGAFLSSGDIIRNYEKAKHESMTDQGQLIPTNKFYDIVLPYFSHESLISKPLVLSSIGRWEGEEDEVMKHAKAAGPPLKHLATAECVVTMPILLFLKRGLKSFTKKRCPS